MVNNLNKPNYDVVEGTDILYCVAPYASNIGSAADNYLNYIGSAKLPVNKNGQRPASIYPYGLQFFRASKGGNVWDDLENGEAILIGNTTFEMEGTPTLDINDNLLLKAVGFGLRDKPTGGNVLINREGRVMLNLGYYGYMHSDVDSYGNYFTDIYVTRSSGGHPVTDKRKYNFVTPTGQFVSNSHLSRTEEPSVFTLKPNHKLLSPAYIFDVGKNNASSPQYFPNVVELLLANRCSKTPFIEDDSRYLVELYKRQQTMPDIFTKLNNGLYNGKVSQKEYNMLMETLRNEIEAMDYFIANFETDADRQFLDQQLDDFLAE